MYNRNNVPFSVIANGSFGRKIAYTDVDIITADNVVKVVGDTIGVHNRNKEAIAYLWRYYKGDQPALYRTKTVRDDIVNKVVENHAYEIVQFKTGQSYGEPVQYISRKDDEKINGAVDRLNDYMTDADKQTKDIKSGEWQSAVGTSFKAIQRTNNKEMPFRIIAPSPMDTYIVYSKATEEPLLSVQELKDENGDQYYLCFSENMEFRIQNGKLLDLVDSNNKSVKGRLHTFNGIPVIEYPNNWERISDIELVISLLDAINNMQSNRMDGVEQFVQSWIRFINCEIDEEEFRKMKMLGALVVKSNNGADKQASVDVMSQELNQTESQVAKDDLWDNALAILAIPNRESQNSGGDTMGAVSLRAGWDMSKTRTQIKDPLIKSAEKKLAKIALNLLRLAGDDLGITLKDFDVQINHSPTDNLYTKSQALLELLQAGVAPMVAIKTVGLWGDSEKTYNLSKPYLDVKYKTVDMVKEENQAQGQTQENENTVIA